MSPLAATAPRAWASLAGALVLCVLVGCEGSERDIEGCAPGDRICARRASSHGGGFDAGVLGGTSQTATTAGAGNEGTTDAGVGAGTGNGGRSDAGTGAGADAGAGGQLPPGQSPFCVYWRTTVTICGGGNRRPTRTETRDEPFCVDGPEFCLAPEGGVTENETCRVRSFYTAANTKGYAAPPPCGDWRRLQNDEVQCLIDSNCLDGERCVNSMCECPEGVTCDCLDSGPVQPRCDGQVLVEYVVVGQDVDRTCLHEEQRTDCAAVGLVCTNDGNNAACVAPSGSADAGSGSGDSGSGSGDSGGGSADAGTADSGTPPEPGGPSRPPGG